MKKYSKIEYVLYLIVRALVAVFQAMPYKVSLAIGRKFGLLGMYINIKRRRIAYANIKYVFSKKYTPYQLKKILFNTYANMGQGIIETFILPKMKKNYGKANFIYEGFENIEKSLDRGKGVILLTGHFGNWEVANAALPLKGYTYTAIARQQKPFLVNKFLNKLRQSCGCKIVYKGIAVRQAIKSLNRNEIVGMLVDQDAGKEGIFVDLFNRPASWNRGVMHLALKTGCTVLPGFIIRTGGAKFKFIVKQPIVFDNSLPEKEKLKSGLGQFASHIEEMILKYPDQWLWQHKRWKSSLQKKILILSDGKLGHLRQSQAVSSYLKDIFIEKGAQQEDISVETIELKHKTSLAAGMLKTSSCFSSGFCQSCLKCLKACLMPQCYKKIITAYADIVISCGNKTVAANLLVSKECNAKSIFIMNSGKLFINKFDLVILPRHDGIKQSKKIVLTEGAPNINNADLMNYHAEILSSEINTDKKHKIGILLGGNNKFYNISEKAIKCLLDKIDEAVKKHNADILITTSRRTPPGIEKLLKLKYSKNKRCKLLIIASENNKDNVVPGILGLCELIIVSPESVSMISEAVSSRAHVVIFDADLVSGRRHKEFIANLTKKGYLHSVGIDKIENTIDYILQKKPNKKALDDSIVIKKSLEKII